MFFVDLKRGKSIERRILYNPMERVDLEKIIPPLDFEFKKFFYHPLKIEFDIDMRRMSFLLFMRRSFIFGSIFYRGVYVINPVYFKIPEKMKVYVRKNGKVLKRFTICRYRIKEGANILLSFDIHSIGHFDLELVKFTITSVILEEKNENFLGHSKY